MNTEPRSPVCGNCGNNLTYCDASLYLDGETCCLWCEHPHQDERRRAMTRLREGNLIPPDVKAGT